MSETEQNTAAEHEDAYDSIKYLKENQFEALKSLAELLLSVIELLEETPSRVEELLADPGVNLVERTQRYERELIRAALIVTNGSQRQAAKLLRTKETTLNCKIKRYGIDGANQHSAAATRK